MDFLISKLVGSQDEPNAERIEPNQVIPSERYVQPESHREPPPTVQVELMHSEVSNDEPIPVQPNVIYVDRLSPLLNGGDAATSEDSSCSGGTRDGNGMQPDYQESPTMQIRSMTSLMSITRAVDGRVVYRIHILNVADPITFFQSRIN